MKSMYKNKLNCYSSLENVFLNEGTIHNSFTIAKWLEIHLTKFEQDIFRKS